MFAKREHLVDYQATSIDSRLVERGSVYLKLRLTRPAATEARLLPGSLVLWLESGKVVLAAVRDRGDTGLLGICLLTDLGRPVPASRSRCTNTLCTMKHSCTHWRSCLGPASVPVHSSALLTWGGQHGHHHYGEDELRVGPRLRSHLRAGRELPSDRHLLGQPLLLTRGGQPPHLPLRLAQFLLAPALPRQLLHHGSQQAERGHSVRTRRGRVGRD